jgi:hypothetical protein
MGYLIRMAPEVGVWLANVRDRDPAAADLIDEAVAALRAGGESVGPPLVVPVDDPPLTALEADRGGLAEQAGERRRAAEERLAEMRRLHTGMQAEEERLTMASFRLQDEVSAFRTRIEALKTAWAAAEAAAEAAWAEAVIDDASADAEGASSAADSARDAAPPGPARTSLELSELRPGVPGSAGARILFTVEPPGTAVLLAAGTEGDWLRAWYTEAIANCRVRYQREQGPPR